MLAPHLTPENYLELLQAARHKSKRAIEELVAELRPKSDVRDSLRTAPATQSPESSAALNEGKHIPIASSPEERPRSSIAELTPAARARVEPLGERRYRLHVTLPDETHEKLQEARALMRHRRPDGDLAAILDRALTLLLKEVKKRRFGSSDRPRSSGKGGKADDASVSRHIPVKIRRRVFRRDEGRCTYVDAQGRRCEAREFLEFHHLDPWARDRHHDADRIVLMCRAHNQWAAEADYGRRFMRRKRRDSEPSPGRAV
jgi:hypothetical protein